MYNSTLLILPASSVHVSPLVDPWFNIVSFPTDLTITLPKVIETANKQMILSLIIHVNNQIIAL